jgi:diguanylate cyclase (GGDEF)-like protein
VGPPFLTVLLVSDDQRIAGTLRLAADLCIGIGAFFVTPAGVQTFISPFMAPDDGVRRVEGLAESCLAHPGSRGRAIFWNAEDADQVGSVDRSLACVVVPAWAGEHWTGLLGVVDLWLPELDDEQRTGLLALAAQLAATQLAAAQLAAVTPGGAPVRGPAPASAPTGGPVEAEPDVDDGGGHLAGWTAPAYLPEEELGPDEPEPSAAGPMAGGATAVGPTAAGPMAAGPMAAAMPAPTRPVGAPSRVDEGTARPGGERLSEPFLGEVLDNLPDGLVVTRSDGAIVLVNQTFTTLSGLDVDDVLGEDVAAIISDAGRLPATTGPGWMDDVLGRPEPGQRVVIAQRSGEPLAAGASGRRISSRFAGDCFVTLVRPAVDAAPTGSRTTPRTASVTAAPAGSATGPPIEPIRMADVGGAVPIQELLDNLDIGIVCCDVTGTVVLANRMARELQGVPADRPMVGLPFPDTTDLRSPQGELVTRDDHPLFRALHHGTPAAAHFVRGNDEGGTHIAISARPVLVGGRSGAIAVLRDVTAEWEEQVNLAHHAFHDPLTGAANRYLLIETLVRMLHGLSRRGGAVLLAFLDLDQFKRINDEHGHEIGDQVLTAVARRLQGVVRSDDIVSRLGGDEFVVAHVSQERTPDGDVVVARIRKALSAPYQFGGLVVDVGVSVGWVSTSSSEVTPEYLLSQADDKMYRNKRQRAGTGRSPGS